MNDPRKIYKEKIHKVFAKVIHNTDRRRGRIFVFDESPMDLKEAFLLVFFSGRESDVVPQLKCSLPILINIIHL